jgi:2-polyprenyl-6-methoxyphenol hydroxylase-like FAD-dependent oxidoreductase
LYKIAVRTASLKGSMMRVLVVGGGIGGLTFINALGRMDCAIDLVERSSEFRPLGVGIVLHPNAMTVLDELGLSRSVLDAGARLNWMELVRSERTLALSLPEIWEGASQPTVAIARHELHEILARKVLADARVNVRMGTRVDHIVPGPTVRVRFHDLTNESYDLIVGADGVHSDIRRLLCPELSPASTGLAYIRFLARCAAAVGPDTWRTHESADASFGFIPLPRDRVHCFFQIRTPIPFAAGGEEGFLRSQVRAGCAALAEAIDARCGPYHTGIAYMVRPECWGRDTCALVGDAAHALPPTLSEGGGLAMEDALVLARTLQYASTIPAAVREYELCRKDRMWWMYRMGLSQVNSLRHARVRDQLDPAIAMRHLREMYAPLRVPALPQSISN